MLLLDGNTCWVERSFNNELSAWVSFKDGITERNSQGHILVLPGALQSEIQFITFPIKTVQKMWFIDSSKGISVAKGRRVLWQGKKLLATQTLWYYQLVESKYRHQLMTRAQLPLWRERLYLSIYTVLKFNRSRSNEYFSQSLQVFFSLMQCMVAPLPLQWQTISSALWWSTVRCIKHVAVQWCEIRNEVLYWYWHYFTGTESFLAGIKILKSHRLIISFFLNTSEHLWHRNPKGTQIITEQI